ncbi:alpha/beta hydrolase [Kribbella qitaiheensis]|uniref:Alpha/beta hydrolase n=1 Tax=Kribbella qitaiheensis TaxID=1544730 RepID=A0A7G6X3C1_9ACTN|nr:alpha/beta hydrolase [Kribbella qitaiheensis]QNE20736.1 alpha/beta hydrolase [Kribbella qitaiheensis]
MTLVRWVVGDEPEVLLVHAGVADSRMWAEQVADLSRDHRVITVDLRGFGETPVEAGVKYSDAQDLLDVLDELQVETTAVVAASFGANVVLQAASHAPERFTRLVLMSPPMDGVERTDDLRAFGAEEDRLLEAGDVDGATDLNVRTWLGPEADDEAHELLRIMQKRAFDVGLAVGDLDQEEYEVDPKVLTMPVKLFHGTHDLDYFHHCATHLAAQLPQVDHVELPWAGHLPTLERRAEGIELVRAALS